jgi:hypothetical protein
MNRHRACCADRTQERTPMRDKAELDLAAPPVITSVRELARAENECTRCPLYKNATQAVPGEGRRHAHLMLVGEQPGDREDLAGKPFVGPAGRILDLMLAEAGNPACRGLRHQRGQALQA